MNQRKVTLPGGGAVMVGKGETFELLDGGSAVRLSNGAVVRFTQFEETTLKLAKAGARPGNSAKVQAVRAEVMELVRAGGAKLRALEAENVQLKSQNATLKSRCAVLKKAKR